MADISQEINDFKNAIYGEEVRGSMISLAEKLNTEVESNTTNVNQAVETANTASTAANQAVEDANTTLQAANQAVTTAAGSAEDAEESATAAANSATAAANSATAAAQSAADAAEAAEGLEGFNGQASSVKAEDTEGLVGTAGGQTNVQALIDYIADQVKNQLVSDSALTTKLAKYILKSQIINNLLATQAGNVLDAVQGKALSDMIGDTSQLPEGAGNVVGAVAQLNSEIENIGSNSGISNPIFERINISSGSTLQQAKNIELNAGVWFVTACAGGNGENQRGCIILSDGTYQTGNYSAASGTGIAATASATILVDATDTPKTVNIRAMHTGSSANVIIEYIQLKS